MEPIRMCLCGDVMTGRGIDQVLPCPGNPILHEPCVRDAREYVRFAEETSGPISRPTDFAYIWGDALAEMQRADTDIRVINLETSVTRCDDYWPDKNIHYRMHPGNIGCLTAASIDCCCLANNHVLDWGYGGLAETLATLDATRLAHAGAGRDATKAAAPAILDIPGKGRVLVFSIGSTTSGIPSEWKAGDNQPGVNLLPDLSLSTADSVAQRINQFKRSGDAAIASIHWGENWGYRISTEEIDFAHRLVEGGVDVIHGHSSHHAKAIEVYRDRPILYGCGDFLNDYEGIRGHRQFRGDLTLLYVIDIDPQDGRLVGMRLVPFQIRHFRLNHASDTEADWLCNVVNREGERFGTQAKTNESDGLTLHWR